ncbi:tol-pal system protein YbgF [Rhodoferax aquaticus]|nr:tol-pal system protein YbgF [Rhodoferax aquaticus]
MGFGKLNLRLFFVFAALWLFVQPSVAGLFDDDEARRAILELRQSHSDLKLSLERFQRATESKLDEDGKKTLEESATLKRSLIELQNQLESLRSDLAKVRGVNEQLAKDLSDVQKRQKDQAQSLDERIKKFEPSRITVDGREFLVEPQEKRDYDVALAILRKGDFSSAQLSFADFLSRYSQSGYRASALFWLGNAQFATKDYKESIVNFKAFIGLGADHPKVPEGLLAIANSQLELKDSKAAKKTLEELVNSFPGTEAASVAKERLARIR